MISFGLLGRHLGHSFSSRIHSLLGGYPYSLCEVEPDELGGFLNQKVFRGLNVTIPYKKAVIPYLDTLTPQAKRLGAVNTILLQPDGTLLGHNTDYFGFQSMLEHSGCQVSGKKVLVLGSGGASNTVAAVLADQGAQVIVISRSGEHNYENLDLHADASILINATPVGMYPDTGISPIRLDPFPRLEAVLDLIYNPARTQLILEAQARSLITENGLWMLVAQAWESSKLFLGQAIAQSRIEAVYQQLCRETENIILIGMPGCGKTTVGARLAHQLGRTFVDSDAAVEELAGCTIPEIFIHQGEAAFRKYEASVLARYGRESGLVLATGGGCVTTPENRFHLRQNGRIFWLTRELSQLATQGRPLSLDGQLDALYQHRRPLYQAFSDAVIPNHGTIDETVCTIISCMDARGWI